MDGWTDGRMDGWMDKIAFLPKHLTVAACGLLADKRVVTINTTGSIQ
jgi:hypothetical protein